MSDPEVADDQRFPVVGIVPVTGTAGRGFLYPALRPGRSGLIKPSFALVDHVRSIDKRRVSRQFGRISQAELDAIDVGLRLFLGLADSTATA